MRLILGSRKPQVDVIRLEERLEVGASMVKWTGPLPCLVLSEGDSILHTNFEFCEEKIIDILETQ